MFKRLYRPFEINRALEVYSKVKSLRKTESIVKISKSTVHRWFHRFGYQGIKKRSLSRKRKKIEHIKKNLTTVLDKNPFVTLESLQKNFQEKPSISTISRILKTLKYKRRKHVPKTYHCSKEMLEKRQKDFSQYIKDVDLSRVISIDET